MKRKELIKKAKTIVVKVGTRVLTKHDNELDTRQIRNLVNQLADLQGQKYHLLVVSSGAIGAGMGLLGIKHRPESLPLQQAMAAIGQSRLMRFYDDYFKKKGILTAQVLLTSSDLEDRQRYLNASNTLLTLLKKKVIPIINENDTVGVDEIKFGDNDRLSVLVANLVQADLLIILSDIDGFYKRQISKISPNGQVTEIFSDIDEITPAVEKMAGGAGSNTGTGGMRAKIQAAKIAVNSGVPMLLANGRTPGILKSILKSEQIGTLFIPKDSALASRKRWIAYTTKPKGALVVDKGAKEALCKRKKSLLASGIAEVQGHFKQGDIVVIADTKGHKFARGLVRYSSQDTNKIKGSSTSEIEAILGHKYYDEVVHRDNLVILEE